MAGKVANRRCGGLGPLFFTLAPVHAGARRLSYYSFDSLGNPWVSGGGARRDFEVLKRLAPRWRITLYVGRYPGFDPGEREGISVRGLGFGRTNALCRLTFALAANALALCDRADRIGYSLSAFAPVLSGILRPDRFYSVLHHIVAGDSVKKYGTLGRVPRLLEDLILRLGRNFIVSNARVGERIRAGNARARVLLTSNSIDGALLSLPPSIAAPPYLLFLGRFDIHMKGIDLLVDAFREVASDPAAPAGLRLILAGAAAPEALQAVRRLVPPGWEDRIALKPNVAEAEKRSLLSGCLFFASPSRFEGFGIAALEANAAGKAVLASDADGFRDSVQRDVTALLVPVGDGAALRAGLKRLLADAGLRERLGSAGRERARGFDWDAIAAREEAWIAGGFPEAGDPMAAENQEK
jgi:glycosyltransferase involved in cell wall biosynthesis